MIGTGGSAGHARHARRDRRGAHGCCQDPRMGRGSRAFSPLRGDRLSPLDMRIEARLGRIMSHLSFLVFVMTGDTVVS